MGTYARISLSYIAAYYLRLLFGRLIPFSEIIPPAFILLVVLCYLCVFYFFGLYELDIIVSLNSLIKILLSILTASILISFLQYGFLLSPIGRGIFFLSNTIIFVLVFCWRILHHHLSKYVIKPKRLIIVGKGKAAREIYRVIESAGSNLELVGLVQEKKNTPSKSPVSTNSRMLGSTQQLQGIIGEYDIDQVVLAGIREEDHNITNALLEAGLKGVEIIDMPEMYQALVKKIPINYVQEKWFINAKGFERINKVSVLRIKRLIDFFISLVLLLISLPLWPFIALMIR